MKRSAKCKCVHCSELFLPDFRNRGRQHHCAKPECRKVARRSSQHRWLAKAENQNYFRGPENCARVREWRARHPGYGEAGHPYRTVPRNGGLRFANPPYGPAVSRRVLSVLWALFSRSDAITVANKGPTWYSTTPATAPRAPWATTGSAGATTAAPATTTTAAPAAATTAFKDIDQSPHPCGDTILAGAIYRPQGEHPATSTSRGTICEAGDGT
jgi:hypothetical protein